jgi:hypothetical protein
MRIVSKFVGSRSQTHLFILGDDYHLGDLLWFTTVLREYRRERHAASVWVACPDRPISRILEGNSLIDRLLYTSATRARAQFEQKPDSSMVVHDLRPIPVGRAMVRDWRFRLPWLYYRDLWFAPRGQWLATFLRLGTMREFRPILSLTNEDRRTARSLPPNVVALAPHVGSYALPLATFLWQRIKGWDRDHWTSLAGALRQQGFEPVTLAASGQAPIPGTIPLVGLPIRQAAGVIERAAALVTGESGLWFIAAATQTPFVIVPWWLPRSVDWPAPMGVPYRTVRRDRASVDTVLDQINGLLRHGV